MKNVILIAACLFILPIDSIAQWSGPTNGWLSTSNSVSISQAGGMTGTPGTTFSPLLSLSLTGLPTTGPGSVTDEIKRNFFSMSDFRTS